MRILFDHKAFEMQRIGGVSRSYAELISHCRDKGCDCIVGVKESDNVYLREKRLVSDVKPLNYRHKLLFEGKKLFKGQRALTRKILGWYGYKNDCWQVNKDYCIKLLKKQRFDVFESTFFDSYFLLYLKDKPFVLTVHDMIPELLGVDEPQAKQKRFLCPLASHIHVPSQNTKSDLVNILGINPSNVTVIPHGAPDTPKVKHQALFGFPYLLYVGARWSYKNFAPFLEECSIIIARHPEIRVVCTGTAFDEEELQLIEQFGIGGKVMHVFASEPEMQSLYQNAVAFVYPSAYEGFGMPILEAFVNRCPVLLNNASCFPEIGGDAAVYFDINKKGDLAEHIVELLQYSDEDRQQIIRKGIQRAKCFSWEESARKLMQVYETIL